MMANWLPQSSADWLVSLVDPFSQGRLSVHASMISCQASPVAHLTSRHAYARTHVNKHAKVHKQNSTYPCTWMCVPKSTSIDIKIERVTKKPQRILTNTSRFSQDLNLIKARGFQNRPRPFRELYDNRCKAKQTAGKNIMSQHEFMKAGYYTLTNILTLNEPKAVIKTLE